MKYQPSNGTEGSWFMGKYCMNCIHCDPDSNGDKQCNILLRVLCYNINDPEYPEEWVYENNEPKCTSHIYWDWGKDGDPDDDNNPKAPPKIPYDPNQLCFPFVNETVERILTEEYEIA